MFTLRDCIYCQNSIMIGPLEFYCFKYACPVPIAAHRCPVYAERIKQTDNTKDNTKELENIKKQIEKARKYVNEMEYGYDDYAQGYRQGAREVLDLLSKL